MTSKKLILGLLLAITITFTMTSNNAYANTPVPTSLTASGITTTSINLTWDVGSGGVSHTFDIFRCIGALCDPLLGDLIANDISASPAPPALSFYSDIGLTPATIYGYKIVSIHTTGPTTLTGSTLTVYPTTLTPPLVCEPPLVLNEAGDACITPPLVCEPPLVLNEAGDACITPPLVCEPPLVLNEAGDACIAEPVDNNGGNCTNCQSPSIGVTDRGIRVVTGGIMVNGVGVDADFYHTAFPLIQAEMNEPVTMRFIIWDDRNDNIAHVEVGLGKGKIGESFGKLESSMIWTRNVMTKEETITYDDTAFSDVYMTISGKIPCKQVSGDVLCDQFDVQFTPVKAIVGDVVFGISIWDDGKNSMTTFFNEGLQIGTESDVIPEVKFVAPEGTGNKSTDTSTGLGDVDNRNSEAFKLKLAWHNAQMEQLAHELGYLPFFYLWN